MPHKKIHREFLRHAENLISDAPGRPYSVDLRRSVSASYYAVWHCICYAWSLKFSPELQQKTYRKLTHTQIKSAAGRVKSNKTDWSDRPCCQGLSDLCEDFMRLQEARHEADYNLFSTFRKVDAKLALSRATRFIETVESASNNAELTSGLDCLLLEGMGIKPSNR